MERSWNDKVYAVIDRAEATKETLDSALTRGGGNISIDGTKVMLCWKSWEAVPSDLRIKTMPHKDAHALMRTIEWNELMNDPDLYPELHGL